MLFANKIRQLREEKDLLQRHLAAALEIDTPMYSKIERGERRAKREQVVKLAELLHIESKELLTLWLADQIIIYIENDKELAEDVLNIVQQNII
ncbi:hypothetical protein EZS27_017851 [termite gut metagenome]|jgi:transcriptional regulator with XRE-family HTH domain|uniref:HTH cro/C1-type domain-containing protein n=1 Tax=termite gut metagenome TaxID=433724 RepID=A0A5J4RL04_9ZZZZ